MALLKHHKECRMKEPKEISLKEFRNLKNGIEHKMELVYEEVRVNKFGVKGSYIEEVVVKIDLLY